MCDIKVIQAETYYQISSRYLLSWDKFTTTTLASSFLLGEHGDEGGDELVVIVDAASVVDSVLPPLLVFLWVILTSQF